MSLRLAKVAAVHPESNSVDLVFFEDGSRVPDVQVMAIGASTNTGLADLPEPASAPSGDKWDIAETKERDIYAVVAFARGVPVVLGFLFPQVCQMLFAERNRRIERHASDVYTSIDDEGNVEVSHPSGTYLRIGTAPAHEDLTGKDLDRKWKISRNTDKAVYVHLSVANAGAEKASFDIDPAGNVALQNDGNLTATTGGTANITSGGAMRLTAPSITLDAPVTTITGIYNVEGQGAVGGDVGTITGNVRIVNGSLTVPDDDVVAGTISLRNHVHTDPQGGNTGAPV